ncbi:MAG: SDR family oxidoreductase [Oscillospiraceae bacterium]|nr:SDR family oxidoreductase [Oscillospiraceae bacterium]
MGFTLPSYELTGKVAIITGSTRGIGNAIAKTMAHYGAAVVITGRKQEACDKVAAEIEAEGGKALGVATDVTSAEARANLIAKTVEKFGRLDILVNNAGTGGEPKKMIDMDEEYFDHYVDADYKALYFMSQAAARQMQAQGCEKGTHPYRIINLSSAAGIKSPIGDTVYGSIKAAVTHLTRIMANELARFGITVNAVAPGYVLTDMTKDVMADEKNAAAVTRMITLRRYAMPEEMAGVINFIASPAGGYMTGVLVPVDGGMTIN